jgi:hypothetical protein
MSKDRQETTFRSGLRTVLTGIALRSIPCTIRAELRGMYVRWTDLAQRPTRERITRLFSTFICHAPAAQLLSYMWLRWSIH